MPSSATDLAIADAQDAFARALFNPDQAVPDGVIGLGRPAPETRFNVYRNNGFASLTECLCGRFPVVERLVGKDFFRATARAFIEAHPPVSPALFEYGGDVPAFLETFEPVADLPYLPDIARIEWQRAAAYYAADATPLAAADLATVPPDRIGDLRLALHPSLGLVASPFPIVSIWETNTHDAEVRRIGPDAPAEDALVLRPAYDVAVHRLLPSAHAFLTALADGDTLSAAVDHASGAAPGFDVAPALGALIALGAFAGFSLAEPAASPSSNES